MSSDDKKFPSAKKAKSVAATNAGVKSPAKSTTQAAQVTNVYKGMAAIAAANGTKPPALSAKHKKLLDRQALLIRIIQAQGVSAPTVSPAVKSKAGAKLTSKSSVQEVAKRVGIWTPSGKLASSYKK